jgi:hypothetical protein
VGVVDDEVGEEIGAECDGSHDGDNEPSNEGQEASVMTIAADPSTVSYETTRLAELEV